MKITTKGRYALRLMLDIAENSCGEYISLKDISARQEISIKYLEQIIGNLCKVGLLKSSRGSFGGYKLSKEPQDYTVGSILRLTEGNLAPVACLEDEPNQCTRCEKCATVDFWKGLYKTINKYVDSVTLADLLKNYKSEEKFEYSL
jgi:Rrf2 family protein